MPEFKRVEKEMFPSSLATIETKGRQKKTTGRSIPNRISTRHSSHHLFSIISTFKT